MLCECVRNLFLEKVLDASLCHFSTDLAKAWVMTAGARKNSGGSCLAYFPGSHPTFPGYTGSLLPCPWLVITIRWLLAVRVSSVNAFVLPFDLVQ